MSDPKREKMLEQLTRPITKTTGAYYLVAFVLFLGVAWGAIAYILQVTRGLGVTGMDNAVSWGVYITNFVFFIGISHAGTLISAILRVSGAEWRRPITRVAEAITVFALVFGGLQVFIDAGRPDRFMTNAIYFGRLGSPLLWDASCITVYLLSSLFYLFLPLIPDMGILRDRGDVTGWRKELYRILSVGWEGNPEQKRRLEKAIGVMAIAIIPIAVSVHSVVSWIFGMTLKPMWHTTILAPYFVVGAIFSGIAALIIAMAILRKVYHLEGFLKPIHFRYLGALLLTMTVLWFYFTLSEYLTTGYGGLLEEWDVFTAKMTGVFSTYFWVMVVSMFLAFILLVFARKAWPVGSTVIASVFVVMGMWIERYTIVVPSLTRFSHGGEMHIYHPSWVEVAITVGSVSGFILLYVIFAKLFPLVSIWEVDTEEIEEAIEVKMDALKSYVPNVEVSATSERGPSAG
ncbi:MAG: NrfD/PsrC family molybdoenzyme membrane anchor subunit [Planctomycetota bacterium]|jgi:molybdopterin-containing oxidoreductase family membrane subunit